MKEVQLAEKEEIKIVSVVEILLDLGAGELETIQKTPIAPF
ncbi:hypothetical protein WDW37_04680 [Bdellovibrionota bacterium FG-1]